MTASLPLLCTLIVAFVGLLAAAGVEDVRSYRISNRLSFAAAALFVAFALAGGADLGAGLLAGAIVLAGGLLLFARGWMGGGDVKLLTAVALWAGTAHLLPMLIVVSLVGGVMSVLEWLRVGGLSRLLHRFAPAAMPWRSADPADRGVVPYGVAIAAGGLYVALARLAPLLDITEFLP